MNAIIILPTYNERENIRQLIPQLELVIKKLPKKHSVSILVVDDSSPDETAVVVRELSRRFRNIHLLMGGKRGLGAAYMRGMKYAIDKLQADTVFEMDADISHEPKLIPAFLAKIDNGYDFVIGSRYMKGGSIPDNWAFYRKLFSIVGNQIVRLGLMIPTIHDWTSGFRAIKAEVIKKVNRDIVKYPGYTFQVALLHRAYQEGFKIAEIPLQFVDRTWGESKIIPSEYIYNVLLYVFTHSTFVRYLAVGASGFLLQTVVSYSLVAMGLFPGLSVGVGGEVAIMSNFILNNLWTFSHKRLHGKKRLAAKLVAFQFTSIGAVIIQVVLVSLLTLLLGKAIWFWAMVFSIIFIVIPYNFFIYNRFIWKTHEKK